MKRLPRGALRRSEGGVSPDATRCVPPEPTGPRNRAGLPLVFAQIPEVFLSWT